MTLMRLDGTESPPRPTRVERERAEMAPRPHSRQFEPVLATDASAADERVQPA
jgi:hypothetical protein